MLFAYILTFLVGILGISALVQPYWRHGVSGASRIDVRASSRSRSSTRFNSRIKLEGSEDFVGKSLVISGPSGAGKGSIIDALMKREPGHYELCVSHTSRKPRPGEVDGTHYHFVSKESMKKDIARDNYISNEMTSALKYKFLENAMVHGNLYGTSVDSVLNIHEKGHVAILDVDTVGVAGIHGLGILPAKYVFVAPPTLEELERRLRKRNTETAEQIELRLKNAVSQMEFGINSEIFDYILENDDLDKAVEELFGKLKEWEITR